jgi:hypothetical protein
MILHIGTVYGLINAKPGSSWKKPEVIFHEKENCHAYRNCRCNFNPWRGHVRSCRKIRCYLLPAKLELLQSETGLLQLTSSNDGTRGGLTAPVTHIGNCP